MMHRPDHAYGITAPHLVLVLITSAFACHSPLQQGRQRVIGVIDDGRGTFPAILPDTAHVGISFTVTVVTLGGGCDQADGAQVQTTGLVADVTPYDLVPPPGTNCISILRTLPRQIELIFGSAGNGVVRVHGRGPNGLETLQGTVTVRP